SSHKLFCKSFPEYRNRPRKDVRRAIFFPVKDEPPRFVWMKTEIIYDEEEGPWQKGHFKEYLGQGGSTNDIWAQRNGMRNRHRTDVLKILVREAAIPEGQPLNRSAIRAADKRFIHFPWM